jgi:NRAMP (natural resistance-associated macrophage protein)-like metal ion transporter
MTERKKKIRISEKISIDDRPDKKTETDIFEQVIETPAKILDETIEITKTVEKAVSDNEPVKKAKAYWHLLGPGLTTGASDDDPSGIATYSQTGAAYGFKFLWLAPLTFPLMSVIQEMCARIGLVTGRGLAANIRHFFPRWVLIACTMFLFIANTFNIGADLGAMSEAVRLFRPEWNYFCLIIIFALIIMLMQIFMTYQKYASYLKWLALVLLAYIFSTLMIEGLSWRQIGITAITPSFSFSKDEILIVTAILGTTISPYLFFWQTSQEVEEKIEKGQTSIVTRQNAVTPAEISDMRVDVWSGMFLSNLVMFFIITACAATLNAVGITNISSAAEAAAALRPLAGEYSYFLFAIGIIGTGALGIPVLAGASSYAFAETFGWKQGLRYKLRQAYSFYGVVILSLLIGVLINLFGLDPIKALIYSAVINGLVAPIVLILILILASSKRLMGSYKNGIWSKAIGIATVALMIVAGVATIWTFIFG